MKPLHEQIKMYRKRFKLTQKELAERLGVTPQIISDWERAKRRPSVKNLGKIAAAIHPTVILKTSKWQLLPNSEFADTFYYRKQKRFYDAVNAGKYQEYRMQRIREKREQEKLAKMVREHDLMNPTGKIRRK